MDPRLQQAISTPTIQSTIGELVRLALGALDNMRSLDESLYARFVASRDAPQAPEAAAASLRTLWEETFSGLLLLLAYCRSLEGERKPQDTPPVADAGAGGGFDDFSDLDGLGGDSPSMDAHASDDGGLDLGSSDIGDLLSGIDEHGLQNEGEKWSQALEKILSIEYGLSSQYTEATQRMNVALASGQTNQVLGLMDDTQSSASEGVHALVTAIYEAFVPDANPATVVPGYLTSLGRALLVRRGLAELATNLAPYNDALQGSDPALYQEALAAIRETTRTFVNSVVCRAMRAADRWQMVEFERELADQPASLARMTSEGLVKYLDSLGSINQREVLLLHDQRTLEQMRDSLSNARQLLDISPRTAYEMLQHAYQAAQRLRGRNPDTDQLIVGLERYAPSASNPTDAEKFLERLDQLLAGAGG